MRKYTIALSSMALVMGSTLAAQKPSLQALCNSEKTADIQSCADQKSAQAEKSLNDTYRQLVGVLAKRSRPDASSALKSSELQWIRSRSLDCQIYKTYYTDGSLGPLGYSFCMADRASERTKFLKSLIDEFDR